MTFASKVVLVTSALLSAPLVRATPVEKVDAVEAYAVCSALMNSQTRGKPDKGVWMISVAMTAYEPKRSCVPDASSWQRMNDPDVAITAPDADKARFREVLADFQANCHEAGFLRAGELKTDWPVRLLTEKEAKRFEADLMPEEPEKLKKWPAGAGGLQSFSRVFFNRDHTLAMVYSSFYCGMLCGTWQWQVLERTTTGWNLLHWQHSVIVS